MMCEKLKAFSFPPYVSLFCPTLPLPLPLPLCPMATAEWRETSRTGMIQMLPKLHIPVPPRRDVEIALHLIPLQAAINPTRPPFPPYPRRLRKLPSPLPQRQHVVHVLFLLDLARRRRAAAAMQPMHALGVDPLLPVRGVAP